MKNGNSRGHLDLTDPIVKKRWDDLEPVSRQILHALVVGDESLLRMKVASAQAAANHLESPQGFLPIEQVLLADTGIDLKVLNVMAENGVETIGDALKLTPAAIGEFQQCGPVTPNLLMAAICTYCVTEYRRQHARIQTLENVFGERVQSPAD